MDILSKIVRRDNLELAWRRVRHHFDTSHYFVDHAEVARFHKDLSGNLRDVAERLASCKYRVAPFRLAPIPKHKLDRSLPPSMREVFWVEPRDQVAWMAVANVVGPLLDAQMPAWSWSCNGYFEEKACTYTEPFEVKACPKCGSPLRVRVNKTDKSKFLGCTGFFNTPSCRYTATIAQ